MNKDQMKEEFFYNMSPSYRLHLQQDDYGWVVWNGDVFFLFYSVAISLASKLGLSQGIAERTLRELCAKGDIRSVHYSVGDEDNLPYEIKPSAWLNNEPDMDGSSQGSAIEAVAVSGADFYYWMDLQKPGEDNRINSPKRDHIIRIIKDLWPQSPPLELVNKAIVKLVREKLTVDCKLKNIPQPEISDDTILRAAGRK